MRMTDIRVLVIVATLLVMAAAASAQGYALAIGAPALAKTMMVYTIADIAPLGLDDLPPLPMLSDSFSLTGTEGSVEVQFDASEPTPSLTSEVADGGTWVLNSAGGSNAAGEVMGKAVEKLAGKAAGKVTGAVPVGELATAAGQAAGGDTKGCVDTLVKSVYVTTVSFGATALLVAPTAPVWVPIAFGAGVAWATSVVMDYVMTPPEPSAGDARDAGRNAAVSGARTSARPVRVKPQCTCP